MERQPLQPCCATGHGGPPHDEAATRCDPRKDQDRSSCAHVSSGRVAVLFLHRRQGRRSTAGQPDPSPGLRSQRRSLPEGGRSRVHRGPRVPPTAAALLPGELRQCSVKPAQAPCRHLCPGGSLCVRTAGPGAGQEAGCASLPNPAQPVRTPLQDVRQQVRRSGDGPRRRRPAAPPHPAAQRHLPPAAAQQLARLLRQLLRVSHSGAAGDGASPCQVRQRTAALPQAACHRLCALADKLCHCVSSLCLPGGLPPTRWLTPARTNKGCSVPHLQPRPRAPASRTWLCGDSAALFGTSHHAERAAGGPGCELRGGHGRGRAGRAARRVGVPPALPATGRRAAAAPALEGGAAAAPAGTARAGGAPAAAPAAGCGAAAPRPGVPARKSRCSRALRPLPGLFTAGAPRTPAICVLRHLGHGVSF